MRRHLFLEAMSDMQDYRATPHNPQIWKDPERYDSSKETFFLKIVGTYLHLLPKYNWDSFWTVLETWYSIKNN